MQDAASITGSPIYKPLMSILYYPMSESVTLSLKTAAKGTAFVLAGMAGSQALWFVTRLLIVRNLSTEDLGIYSLATAIGGIVSLIASMGLWEGATRYVSIFAAEGRAEDVESVRRSSLAIGAISGAAACAVVFLLSRVLSEYVFYKPGLADPLMVIAFSVPAYVMAYILTSIIRGHGIINPKVYFMDVGQPLIFLILLLIIFILSLPFVSIFCAYVLSMAAVFVLTAWYGQGALGIRPLALNGGRHIRELLRFSVPVAAIDAMTQLYRSADTLMLGRYGSAEELGAYSVSVSLAAFLTLPLVALDIVYMPIAGELYARRSPAELSRTYRVLTKWIFSVTLPLFFILFFFPEMTITFLFGDRFVASASPLRVLSLGYLVNAFLGTNAMLLLVMGRSGTVMKVFAAGTMLNVLMNYILIKHAGLGLQGAAISSMVSIVTISLGCSFVLYRLSGIHPLSSAYLKPVTGSAIIGVAIYAAAKGLPLYFWILPVYFLLYICGYLASLILTRSLDAEDVFLFSEILKRAGVEPETTRRIMKKIRMGNTGQIDER